MKIFTGFLAILLLLGIYDCMASSVPGSCKRHLDWAYRVGKRYYRGYYNAMPATSGVAVKDASFEDFQRLFKCTNIKKKDCNDRGLQFPTKCSKPPCNKCDTTVPKSCMRHLDWAVQTGKYSHAGYYSAMLATCGVAVKDASYQDFQRLFKCIDMQKKDCNDQGLEFPTTCSNPPCNKCDGTVPLSCKKHIDWTFEHGREDRYQYEYLQIGSDIREASGVGLNDATYQDFQRLFKCAGIHEADCNDQGLQFPKTCSKPPCNKCPGKVPEACKKHLEYSHMGGGFWHTSQHLNSLYSRPQSNIQAISGVALKDSTMGDLIRFFKCAPFHKKDCNDQGLGFPIFCTVPPCNKCGIV